MTCHGVREAEELSNSEIGVGATGEPQFADLPGHAEEVQPAEPLLVSRDLPAFESAQVPECLFESIRWWCRVACTRCGVSFSH